MTEKQIVDALEDCLSVFNAENCPFNGGEMEFLQDISDQFDESGTLSENQEERLERLWDKV